MTDAYPAAGLGRVPAREARWLSVLAVLQAGRDKAAHHLALGGRETSVDHGGAVWVGRDTCGLVQAFWLARLKGGNEAHGGLFCADRSAPAAKPVGS
jgi:hypothetical protein